MGVRHATYRSRAISRLGRTRTLHKCGVFGVRRLLDIVVVREAAIDAAVCRLQNRAVQLFLTKCTDYRHHPVCKRVES